VRYRTIIAGRAKESRILEHAAPHQGAPLLKSTLALLVFLFAASLAGQERKRPEPLDIRIKLPYRKGARFKVIQGNFGTFSHFEEEECAWDFAMGEGTSVCACAEGRVVWIDDDSKVGGDDKAYEGKANFILIDHGGGVFSEYKHLKHASARVKIGQIVRAGQVIARSGNTGYSTEPHLHFELQDYAGASLPSRFVDVFEDDGIPELGTSYTSGNDGKGTSRFSGDSELPEDAFSSEGIVVTRSLPCAYLDSSSVYELKGTVTEDARRVVFFFAEEQTKEAALAFFGDVDAEGHFAIRITFPERAPKGKRRVAMALVKLDGSYWCPYSYRTYVK
jgi:murein DD-endopeptidase MepM/ murein hydrolase activator NlpD